MSPAMFATAVTVMTVIWVVGFYFKMKIEKFLYL